MLNFFNILPLSRFVPPLGFLPHLTSRSLPTTSATPQPSRESHSSITPVPTLLPPVVLDPGQKHIWLKGRSVGSLGTVNHLSLLYRYINTGFIQLPATEVTIIATVSAQKISSIPKYKSLHTLGEALGGFFIQGNPDISNSPTPAKRMLILAYMVDHWRLQYITDNSYAMNVQVWKTSITQATFTIHLEPTGTKGYLVLPTNQKIPFTLPQSLYVDSKKRIILTGFFTTPSTLTEISYLKIETAP